MYSLSPQIGLSLCLYSFPFLPVHHLRLRLEVVGELAEVVAVPVGAEVGPWAVEAAGPSVVGGVEAAPFVPVEREVVRWVVVVLSAEVVARDVRAFGVLPWAEARHGVQVHFLLSEVLPG